MQDKTISKVALSGLNEDGVDVKDQIWDVLYSDGSIITTTYTKEDTVITGMVNSKAQMEKNIAVLSDIKDAIVAQGTITE